MFGKRCSLCGGKLDNRGICTECGLDNNKSDKNYRLNQSECDNMPLTHVHVGKEKAGKRKKDKDNNKANRKASREKPSKKPWKKIALAIIVIAVLGDLYDMYRYDIEYAIQDVFHGNEKAEVKDFDYYQYATRKIPEDGESADYELFSGNYIVGVEIPEGIYTVTTKEDYDTVQIDDPENGIYLYKYTEGKTDKIEDVRLYKGAVLTLECKTTEKLHTDNAQDTEKLENAGESNPLEEMVNIKGQKKLTAGKDFAAGIYDVNRESGEGNVDVTVYSEEQEEIDSWNQYLSEDGTDGDSFHYLVLPQNATIEVSEGLKISLKPAERIATTDYYGFYKR